jgi:ATP-dependent DNA helicase HFM1/MER3
LSTIAQAAEFKDLKMRSGEKAFYKLLNQSPWMKFPIHVDLALPAHKVSVIVQAALGGIDYPVDEKFKKMKVQYQTDSMIVFRHINRFIRCIIDCQIQLGDAVTARNALMLARSFGALAWDNSPLEMKQIESIGLVAVRKLVNHNIKSIEDLEQTEAHRIETILNKRPPYGLKIIDRLKEFPRLRVSLQIKTRKVYAC